MIPDRTRVHENYLQIRKVNSFTSEVTYVQPRP